MKYQTHLVHLDVSTHPASFGVLLFHLVQPPFFHALAGMSSTCRLIEHGAHLIDPVRISERPSFPDVCFSNFLARVATSAGNRLTSKERRQWHVPIFGRCGTIARSAVVRIFAGTRSLHITLQSCSVSDHFSLIRKRGIADSISHLSLVICRSFPSLLTRIFDIS